MVNEGSMVLSQPCSQLRWIWRGGGKEEQDTKE